MNTTAPDETTNIMDELDAALNNVWPITTTAVTCDEVTVRVSAGAVTTTVAELLCIPDGSPELDRALKILDSAPAGETLELTTDTALELTYLLREIVWMDELASESIRKLLVGIAGISDTAGADEDVETARQELITAGDRYEQARAKLFHAVNVNRQPKRS